MRAEILILKQPLILNFSIGEEPEAEEAIIAKKGQILQSNRDSKFRYGAAKRNDVISEN